MGNIILGSCIFLAGVFVGNKIKTAKINAKIQHLHNLADEIKEKNNKMVDNLSFVCWMNHQDSSKFTEDDEMLLNMWID